MERGRCGRARVDQCVAAAWYALIVEAKLSDANGCAVGIVASLVWWLRQERSHSEAAELAAGAAEAAPVGIPKRAGSSNSWLDSASKASSKAVRSGVACCLAMAALGGGDFRVALLVGLIGGAVLEVGAVGAVGAFASSLLGALMDSICVSVGPWAGAKGWRSWSPMLAWTKSSVPAGGFVTGRRDQRGGEVGGGWWCVHCWW